MSWRNTVFPDGVFMNPQDFFGLIEPMQERVRAVSDGTWDFSPGFFQPGIGNQTPLNYFDTYGWYRLMAGFDGKLRAIIPYFINHTVDNPNADTPVFWSYDSIFAWLGEEPVPIPTSGDFTIPWAIEWARQAYRVLNLLRWTQIEWSISIRLVNAHPIEVLDVNWGYGVCFSRLADAEWGNRGFYPANWVVSAFTDLHPSGDSYNMVQGRLEAVMPKRFPLTQTPAPGSVEMRLRVVPIENERRMYFNAWPYGELAEGEHVRFFPTFAGAAENFAPLPLTLMPPPPEVVPRWLAYTDYGSKYLPDDGGPHFIMQFKYGIIKHEQVPNFRYFDP